MSGPVHPWSVERMVVRLGELYFLKRATAHILAGWIAKIPDAVDKAALAQHLQLDVEHAMQLIGRMRVLSRLDGTKLAVSAALHHEMRSIDASETTQVMIDALYGRVRPRMAALAADIAAEANPILDASTVRLAKQILDEDRGTGAWGAARVQAAAWEPAGSGESISLADSIWSPVDRVPFAVRASTLRRGTPGAMRAVPTDHLSDPNDLSLFIHGSICEELTTLELIARCSYEHPTMPERFHLDMARQCGDEGRHALALMGVLERMGVRYGDHLVYTSSYDTLYAFDECEPGSRNELLWRMLLRQTFHEGMALDNLALEVRDRRDLQQTVLADVFGFLLADEVMHVDSGLRWSRWLCDGDAHRAMQVRAEAHASFTRTLQRRREAYVNEDVDRAAAEVSAIMARLKTAQRAGRRKLVNRAARQAAGYLDEEVKQVIEWGYVLES